MPTVQPNQIEKILTELMGFKDKMANVKEVLRSYKIRSELLTQLKRAKKDLNERIQEERKNIEDEHLEDEDYETASNDQLTLRNQIKEKNADLRETMAQVNTNQQLSTYDYNIKGEALKMQVERVVKVYINGREER